MGLSSYYHRENSASIATHLIRTTEMEASFVWSYKCEERFKNLKSLLTIALILGLMVEGKDFIMFYDASHSRLCVMLR